MKRKVAMIMSAKSLGRHFKTAFNNIKRNGWMTLAAVSAVTITLFLLGSLIAIIFNVNALATDIEEDVSVRVYIDHAADQENMDQLQEELESIANVESVEFSNRDEELQNVIGSYGEEFALDEGDENPLHDVFVVHASNPEETGEVAQTASELDYVSDVNYGGETAERLFSVTTTLRNVGLIILAALIFIAIFLISNTIRITILSRKREIEIMKLVGASNWFIRWPFVIEGAITGLLGSILPILVISVIYISGYNTIMNYLSTTNFSILPPNPFLWIIILVLILIGVVIGSIGSAMSIRKFLKI